MENFFDIMNIFKDALLGLLEDHYEVSKGRFSALHNMAQNELRLLHYPDIKTELLKDTKKAVRFGQHTDFGTITILFQAPAGGLYFRSMNGDWNEILSSKTDAIITFGDTFERWTNGRVHAGVHCVQAPSQAQDQTGERYAIAYFGKANRNQSVGVLPEFANKLESPKYEDMTAEEYNQYRMLSLY